MPLLVDTPAASSSLVFDRLLAEIVSGRHAAGARLPAERDLAVQLGTSRPTLREALRRLGEWGLVEARRGSGVVVRGARDWSLDVLPAYLRYGSVDPERVALVIVDLLALRRALFLDLIRIVGDRFTPGSLEEAREAIARAWAAREDVAAFVAYDLDAIRAMMESARLLPAVWLLNGFGGVYAAIARGLTGAAVVPSDYRASWNAVFDSLERKQVAAAARRLGDYLERHDHRLLTALGIPGSRRSAK